MAATFSSALAYALSCVGKPGLVLKDKQLEALKCLYAGVYVGTVPTGYGKSQSKSICFPDTPFLDWCEAWQDQCTSLWKKCCDGDFSSCFSEWSHLQSVGVSAQCHSLWKEALLWHLPKNWSQSKYVAVVSDPRNVSPECVYNPRDLSPECVSDPRDLLLECVLMDSVNLLCK